MSSIAFNLMFLPLILCRPEKNEKTSPEEFKCTLPDIASLNDNLDIARFRADFSKVSEVSRRRKEALNVLHTLASNCCYVIACVKFPGLIGPLNEKLICKIKCIDGNWVGPLCSTTPDGRFQPILRECIYRNEYPLLGISFKNSSIDKETHFPHGSMIRARCKLFGLYKLKGENILHCENGEWSPKFPECVPTTIVTNFSGDSPPTVQYATVSGSTVVEPSGELYVYPESTIRLDCISPRALGDPEWSWTQAIGQHSAAWSTEDGEKETHYRLTLSKMSARNSDQYTCTSPGGHTNTIQIRVVNVNCPTINMSSPRMRQFAQGSRLGHTIHFSCHPGFHLNGSAVVTCMGDGHWSHLPPTCVETLCPILRTLSPHLTVVEYNSSFGGRAVFQCAWGYRLIGTPGLECEHDGQWSGEMPHCSPIYCPNPLIPENGKLLTHTPSQDTKYLVGDLMTYSCKDDFEMDGESSIVCTENGYWSHPPPFCLPPSEIRKSDMIYIENTTFIHIDE